MSKKAKRLDDSICCVKYRIHGCLSKDAYDLMGRLQSASTQVISEMGLVKRFLLIFHDSCRLHTLGALLPVLLLQSHSLLNFLQT